MHGALYKRYTPLILVTKAGSFPEISSSSKRGVQEPVWTSLRVVQITNTHTGNVKCGLSRYILAAQRGALDLNSAIRGVWWIFDIRYHGDGLCEANLFLIGHYSSLL
jgi:hypothetical protein